MTITFLILKILTIFKKEIVDNLLNYKFSRTIYLRDVGIGAKIAKLNR